MAEYVIDFEAATAGAALTSGNTGFDSVLGAATMVASTANPADGTKHARVTFTAASQAAQFIKTFTATTQLSTVFKDYTAVNYAATPQTLRFFVSTTNMVSLRPVPDGRITILVNGTTVYTSTGTRPLGAYVRYSLWAKIGATGTTGSVRFDAYLGNSTTPITGLSFSSDAMALGTAGFTSIQGARPGAASDTTTVDLDSFRIRTDTEAAAKDAAAFTTGTPPAAVTPTVGTVTTVDWTGSTGTLSGVTATPAVTGLTTTGLKVSFTETPGRASTTISGTLTNDAQTIPVSVVVPALEGGGTGVQRVGNLVRLTPTSGWV